MSVLDDARKLIESRLDELEREAEKLKEALKQLDGGSPRRGGRPKGRARAKRATPKRRRQGRKGGGRADQAVALVQATPGISAGEVAKKLKIKPNYVYRVLGQLEKDGRVKKEGRRYSAA